MRFDNRMRGRKTIRDDFIVGFAFELIIILCNIRGDSKNTASCPFVSSKNTARYCGNASQANHFTVRHFLVNMFSSL